MSVGGDATANILLLHPFTRGVEKYVQYFSEARDVKVVPVGVGCDVPTSRKGHSLSAPEVVRRVELAEAEGFKAVVLTCHGDPELAALRDAVRIPVLGPMQVGLHFASLLAHRFSVLTTDLWIKREQEGNVLKYDLASKVASVRLVPLRYSLPETGRLGMVRPIPEDLIGPLVDESVKAAQEDDASAVVFGCGSLLGTGDELQSRLRERGLELLVVNPLPLALELARVLIRQGMSHSKLAYPSPA